MLINEKHLEQLNSPKQTIKARAELYLGSALDRVCTCSDILSELAIERTGEGKFFGFGICQKLRTSLIDIDRDIIITKDHTIDAAFGVESNYIYPFPRFYVQDVQRDETSNMLNIEAYDILYKAETYKVNELDIYAPYTLRTMAMACAAILKVPIVFKNIDSSTFDVSYPEGANLDGTESVRFVLNAIAEATQTIYYINNNWELTFQRLDKDAELAQTIGKAQYIELTSGGSRTISNIGHTTELEDNVSTEKGDDTGITQFVRNNPFWELREDIDDLLNASLANIAGLTINQFEAIWTGNYLLEIGDRIGFVGEDDETITTFLLDDTITFDGTLMEQSKWEYDENEGETLTNPVSLGEALNQTFARVDKVNKEITLHASEIEDNKTKLSEIKLNTDGITLRVEEAEGNLQVVNMQQTAMEQKIDNQAATFTAFKKDIDENGIALVKTTTSRFDDSGLTINATGVATSTNLNANGLVIYLDELQKDDDGNITNEKLLEVNDQGINAKDLHATTWLRIGGRSRFENYESNRTGCFWIGGND